MQLINTRLALTLCFLMVASKALAGSDYQSPRTLSLGGSGHAAPLQTDPIAMNASNAAFLPAYQVTAAIHKYKGSRDNQEPRGRVATFGVLDGSQAMVPVGVLYTKRALGSVLMFGSAYKINESWAGGLTVKTTLQSDTKPQNRDFSTSVTYRPSKSFQFAFITDNTIQRRSRSDAWGQYREYILGTKYILDKSVFAYFDPHYTPSREKKLGYQFGLEVAAFSDLYLRVGKSIRSLQAHLEQYGDSIGYGFGYLGPRFSLDFAISHAETDVRTRSMVASLALMF